MLPTRALRVLMQKEVGTLARRTFSGILWNAMSLNASGTTRTGEEGGTSIRGQSLRALTQSLGLHLHLLLSRGSSLCV
jgi:hypothetical protein